jgi:signal transduction histidine kinase
MAAPTRLTQVLVNLIVNAVHAMQGADRAPLLCLSCTTNSQGEAVLAVSDTGPGVPASIRERIFEPFFTTKPPGDGNGLGLSTAREIVVQHGGTLGISETAGRTVFRVELPAESA